MQCVGPNIRYACELKKEENIRTKKGEPFRTPLHETEVSIVA